MNFAELSAERDGFILGLSAKQGDMLHAGETFCYLAEDADWKVPKDSKKKKAASSEGLPDGLRITQPALALAQSKDLDLVSLPIGPIITESYVRKATGKTEGLSEIIIPAEASTSFFRFDRHGPDVVPSNRGPGGSPKAKGSRPSGYRP